jgi:Zn finger protein HypA/HybF involved in hydrogenase expression
VRDSFKRAAWQREVERTTSPHRVRMARKHQGEARAAAAAGEFSKAAWHEARAAGQIRRFEKVNDCGSSELLVRCEDCAHEVKRMEIRCGVHRLCVVCRGARADLYRARFRLGRTRLLARAERLLHGWQRGGRWSEKFVTFTLPHSGDIARDLRTLPRAWRIFYRRLVTHVRTDRSVPRHELAHMTYVRVVEVTAGRVNDGHAHMHVYFFGPYLLKPLIRHLWGAALVELGYEVPTEPIDEVYAGLEGLELQQAQAWLRTRRGTNGRALDAINAPIIDIGETYGDFERELVKYLIKDAELDNGSLAFVDPTLFAGMYEGLEGLRALQASRGFLPTRKGSCACEKCGSQNVTRSRVKPGEGAPTPKKPGDHA